MNSDRNSGSYTAQSSAVYGSSQPNEQSPMDQWSRPQYAQHQPSYTYPPPLPEGIHYDGQHRSGRIATMHARPPMATRHDSGSYYGTSTYPSNNDPQDHHQGSFHPSDSRVPVEAYRSQNSQHASAPPAAPYQSRAYYPEPVFPQPRVQRALNSESGTPVKCPECDAVFSRQHDMKRHASSVHAKHKHICPKCSKEFSRQDSVSRHIKDNRCSASSNNNNTNNTTPQPTS